MIEQIAVIVRERMGEDATGHDWWHVDRVRTMALRIADKEGGGSPGRTIPLRDQRSKQCCRLFEPTSRSSDSEVRKI
jgi:hypothetical protein